jgi:hypothetical protein
MAIGCGEVESPCRSALDPQSIRDDVRVVLQANLFLRFYSLALT